MNNISQDVKDFPVWCRDICSNYPEILENMLKSSDIITVAIAKRIRAVGGTIKT